MSTLTRPSIQDRLREDELTDECKDLISSLPRETGSSENLYQYEGFWLPARFLQALVACNNHFIAQDSDTILVTTPKSGTTWLKAMAFALSNRSRFLDLHHHPLLTINPHDLVLFLETTLYNCRELPDLSTFDFPRIFATHVPVGSLPKSVKDSSCKIVYMCRNPKDVFVSLFHFSNKLRSKKLGPNKLEDAFDRFCNGVSAYGPYWDHVLGYWKKSLENPRKILFLKYEEIQEQPANYLKRLAEFLECPFTPEEDTSGEIDQILKLCSFDHLSNLSVNKQGDSNQMYFRKGEVGGWKETLTPAMERRINQITEQKMQNFGFKF